MVGMELLQIDIMVASWHSLAHVRASSDTGYEVCSTTVAGCQMTLPHLW